MERVRRSAALGARVLGLLAAAALPAAAQEKVTRVSVDSSGLEADLASGTLAPTAISADGRFVAFDSDATNLVANDTNNKSDVFVHDRLTGATARVSVANAGVEANGASFWPSLSSDGRFVAFQSKATNLIAVDTNGSIDVFVHDRDPDKDGIYDEGNGMTTLVSMSSTGAIGNNDSTTPSISGDGMLVAFGSVATNLVPSDRNRARDIFVHDRGAATTIRVSVNSSGMQANFHSFSSAISADGKFVAFTSAANNLVSADGNLAVDVFLRDLVNLVTTRASVDSSGREGNGDSFGVPSLSADGSMVAFASASDNLDSATDANLVTDIFVRDVAHGATARVSIDSSGAEADGASIAPAISGDGTFVAFQSDADDLVSGDGNAATDIFLRDLAQRTTVALSADCIGVLGSGASFGASISDDGQLVPFTSDAGDLVNGDTNGVSDVFVWDAAATGTDATWSTYGAGFPGTNGIPTLTPGADPVLGTSIPVAVSNSSNSWTIGFLLVGLDSASDPTHDGGTILVDYMIIAVLSVPPTGASFLLDIPLDATLCGLPGYLQNIEMDAGAQYGLSFTPGLQLLCGH